MAPPVHQRPKHSSCKELFLPTCFNAGIHFSSCYGKSFHGFGCLLLIHIPKTYSGKVGGRHRLVPGITLKYFDQGSCVLK